MPKRKAPATAWKPGQSGNPEGSRGRKIMSDALALALNRKADEVSAKACAGIDIDPNDIRYIHVIAGQLAKKAAEGDIVAIKEIFDRIDGKVPQAQEIDVTSAGKSIAPQSEAVSNFASWLEVLNGSGPSESDEDVGSEGSVLPDSLRSGPTRH